jgi:hypothetical protein
MGEAILPSVKTLPEHCANMHRYPFCGATALRVMTGPQGGVYPRREVIARSPLFSPAGARKKARGTGQPPFGPF